MQIVFYIKELLHHYESVVVPGLGGFVKLDKNAYITSNYRLTPPRKTLIFNPRIDHNDGLLPHFIAAKENIPYNDAFCAIDKWVNQIKKDLSVNDYVGFDAFGDFYLNTQAQMVFKPSGHIDFGLDSYGLRDIPVRYVLNTAVKKSSVRRSLEWVAVLLPLAMLGIGYSLGQDSLRDLERFAFGSFIPSIEQNNIQETVKPKFYSIGEVYRFSAPLNVSDQIKTPFLKQSLETKHSSDEPTNMQDVALDSIEVKKQNEHKNEINHLGVKEVAVPDDQATFPQSKKFPYYLIVGAFQEHSRAVNLVELLHNYGNDQAHIVGKKGRFYLVALGRYQRREEVQKVLNDSIDYYPGLWVYN